MPLCVCVFVCVCACVCACLCGAITMQSCLIFRVDLAKGREGDSLTLSPPLMRVCVCVYARARAEPVSLLPRVSQLLFVRRVVFMIGGNEFFFFLLFSLLLLSFLPAVTAVFC